MGAVRGSFPDQNRATHSLRSPSSYRMRPLLPRGIVPAGSNGRACGPPLSRGPR